MLLVVLVDFSLLGVLLLDGGSTARSIDVVYSDPKNKTIIQPIHDISYFTI